MTDFGFVTGTVRVLPAVDRRGIVYAVDWLGISDGNAKHHRMHERHEYGRD